MTVFLTKHFKNSCGHCRDFESIWKQLKEKFGTVAMEVDCGITGNVLKDIQGVPTIRYTIEHTGERTFDAISKILEKLSSMNDDKHNYKNECSCKSKK
jgi:hypothetical protein